MLTAIDVMTEYSVIDGIVRSPGKFEGEPVYAPALYDLICNGMADDNVSDVDGTEYDVLNVDDDLRAEYPSIAADTAVILCWESTTGFFNTRELSSEDYEQFTRDIEAAEPTEPEESDLTSTDHETFFQDGRVVLRKSSGNVWVYAANGRDAQSRTYSVLGRFGDDYKAALRAYMDKTQFWPNCWIISDHGNAHLIDLAGKD